MERALSSSLGIAKEETENVELALLQYMDLSFVSGCNGEGIEVCMSGMRDNRRWRE